MTYRLPLRAAGLLLALALAPSLAFGQSSDSATPTSTRDDALQTVREFAARRNADEAIQASFRALKDSRTTRTLLDELRRVGSPGPPGQSTSRPGVPVAHPGHVAADVLALYREVLVKIQTHYVDPEKATHHATASARGSTSSSRPWPTPTSWPST